MRNNRMAQQLRRLSMKPSLESDGASTTETGPTGEGVVGSDAAPAQDCPADGASAPGEDSGVTATIVTVGERSDAEGAETVSTDSEAVAPTVESEGGDSSTTTGDGEQIVSADAKPVDETPADGAGAPGEDKNPTVKIVEVGERSDVETAETVSSDSPVVTSTESEDGSGESTTVTGDGEQIVSADAKPADETPADGAGAPGEDEIVDPTVVEIGDRSDLETAETVSTDSGNVTVSTESLTLAALGFIGISAAFSSWFASKNQDALVELEALTEKVEAKRKEVRAADEEFKKRAEAVIAKAKAEGKTKAASVSQEGVGGAVGGALYAGLLAFTWGPLVGPMLSMGLWGTQWASSVAKLRKQHSELEELEMKLVERQLDMATRIADAEKKYKVSQESHGEDLKDLNVSQEGWAGGLAGFLLGAVSWTPFVGASIHAAAKAQRLKLREDIENIARRIEQVRNGQLEKAKKEGKALPKKLENLDWKEIVKSALIGQFFGSFYGAWQGSELEDLNRQLQAKLKELDKEMEAAGISNESFDDGDGVAQAAVAAAAAVAEGAAAAAEAAAAAVSATTSDDSPTEVAADASASAAEASEVAETADEGSIEDASVDELEGHEELDDLEEAIVEGEETVEKYEQSAATLESLIDALRDARQSGGLTPQSARFFQISFENVGTTLTGAPFKNERGENAIPSLEAFGGTMRRDKATDVSMEAVEGWWKKVWEVLKATAAQVREWLVKFFQTVFTQTGRLRKRAEGLKAAAKNLNSAKLKERSLSVPKALGDRIAMGNAININHLTDLVPFVVEAGTRGSEGTRAVIQMRLDLQNMVRNAAEGGKLSDTVAASGDMAFTGELRSAVFSIPHDADGVKGFKTKDLPGNVEFVAIDPLASGEVRQMFGAVFRGWKVIKIDNGNSSSGDYTTASLSPSQIGSLADGVLSILEAVEKVKGGLKEEALDVGNINMPSEVPDTEARKIKAMAWATSRILQAQSSSITKILKYAVNTASGYLDYATLAAKQYSAAEA